MEGYIKISSELGLHARPATALVKLVRQLKCQVHFRKDLLPEVSGTSLVGLLSLGAGFQEMLYVRIIGENEEEEWEILMNFFKNGFEHL